jgi:ABC-type polysaccharide/polyol phosphate export permease
MRWSSGVRQVHRWTSVVFTVVVLVVTVANSRGTSEPPEWVYLLPLLPLAVLFLSGGTLFVLPYLARRRRKTSGESAR